MEKHFFLLMTSASDDNVMLLADHFTHVLVSLSISANFYCWHPGAGITPPPPLSFPTPGKTVLRPPWGAVTK